MADDAGGEQDGIYNWILWALRRLVHWGSFFLAGCGTLLVFWFHWGNKYKEYGVKVYDGTTAGACYTNIAAATAYIAATPGQTAATRANLAKAACATGAKGALVSSVCPADDPTCACATAAVSARTACRTTLCTYADWMCAGGTCQGTNIANSKQYCGLDQTTWCRVKCTGECVLTDEPMSKNNGYDCGPLSDNNKDWRDIFTFKPNKFLDMFTPIALGGIEFLQHVGPEYAQAMISGTWVVRAIWLFVVSLFAQFGYAGDLGVLLGYLVDFAVVLPCIGLAILDHQSDEDGNSVTTADLVPSLKWFLGICGADALCPGLANVKSRTVGAGGSGGGDEQASA